MGDVRKAHRILVEKPVGRQQLGKSSRLEDVIKMDLRAICHEVVKIKCMTLFGVIVLNLQILLPEISVILAVHNVT